MSKERIAFEKYWAGYCKRNPKNSHGRAAKDEQWTGWLERSKKK